MLRFRALQAVRGACETLGFIGVEGLGFWSVPCVLGQNPQHYFRVQAFRRLGYKA